MTQPDPPATDAPEPPDEPAGDRSPGGADWRPTPIWYAAEIIVVVVGVIIALAANAWWEDLRRADLQTEIRALVRAEIEANVVELREILEATDDCVDRMDRFLRMTPEELRAVPSDSTFYWVSALSCRRTFEPAFGAARALTGASGVESLDDLRARASVADWVTALDDATEEGALLSAHADQVYVALSRHAAATAGSGLADFPTIPRLVARLESPVLTELRRDTMLVRASLRRTHYQRAYGQELAEALVAADAALAGLAEGGR